MSVVVMNEEGKMELAGIGSVLFYVYNSCIIQKSKALL